MNIIKKILKQILHFRILFIIAIGLCLLNTNFFKIMYPRKITFLDANTGQLRPFFFPKDTVCIYQAKCESKEEIISFLIACARLKKITDIVGSKLAIIITKPQNLSETDFFSIIRNDLRNEFIKAFPDLLSQLKSLDILIDFKNTLKSQHLVNKSLYASCLYRPDKERVILVAPCNCVPISQLQDNPQQMISGFNLFKMIDMATNNKLSEMLLEEKPNPDLTNAIANAIQPGEV